MTQLFFESSYVSRGLRQRLWLNYVNMNSDKIFFFFYCSFYFSEIVLKFYVLST